MNKYDEWRANYDKMTYIDQLKYAMEFRGNGSGSETRHQLMSKEVELFLAQYDWKSFDILEFGGWEGNLANEILKKTDHWHIIKWHNYDFAIHAILDSECNDWRYRCIIQNKPVWDLSNEFFKEFDIFIASHCLEHIKFKELKGILTNIVRSPIEFCLLDIPITDTPVNWNGYEGTHILEVGYLDVIKIFSEHFDLKKRNNSFTLWRRKH